MHFKRRNQTIQVTEPQTVQEGIINTTPKPKFKIKPIPLPRNELVTESVTEPTQETNPEEEETIEWQGTVLNSWLGTVEGPSGKETYYNLPMDYVVSIMRDLGYSEEEYPYHVRDDGVKMLGPYVMCAANLELPPKCTILESSLGTAIVCDTGAFAKYNKTQIDIAVDW